MLLVSPLQPRANHRHANQLITTQTDLQLFGLNI